MAKISEHFTLEEFTYSDTARALGIKNEPTTYHLNAMKHTCQYLLEPIRALLIEQYKQTVYIRITSGYRSALLNTRISGSAKNSQHLTGEAADIEAYYYANGKKVVVPYTTLYELIKKWVKEKKISVDQCIQEKSGLSTWVHVSHSSWGKTKDRRQFLKYNGKVYTTDVVVKW